MNTGKWILSTPLLGLTRGYISLITFALISTAMGDVDYDTARTLGTRISGKVSNEKITPLWAPDGSALYRHKGSHILRVDTRTGKTEPAIDHALLKKNFKGLDPRIRRFEIAEDGSFICLAVAGKQVRTLRISGNSVEETDAFVLVPRKATGGTKSGKGNRASQIFFINNTTEPVDIFWVDSSKVRKKYTTLQPGETSTQNTYAGHVFIAGNLAFTASEKPAMAYLATEEATAPPAAKASYDWSSKFRKNNLFVSLRGKETQLTTDGSKDWNYCGPLHWAPDGSHLVAMR
jgi:hypothetical protein